MSRFAGDVVRYSRGSGVHRRGSRHNRRKRRSAVLCVALIVAAGLAAWRIVPRHTVSFDDQSNSLQRQASDNSILLRSPETIPTARPGRVVYPYSVVPGGVQDPADLQRASAQDRVVSNHFAGFNYQGAHVVRLQQAKEVYLSYRIGERVFWTRKKVRLKPGEKL